MSSRASSSRKRARITPPATEVPVDPEHLSESDLDSISNSDAESDNDFAASSARKKGKAPVKGRGKGKAPATTGKVTVGRKRKRCVVDCCFSSMTAAD